MYGFICKISSPPSCKFKRSPEEKKEKKEILHFHSKLESTAVTRCVSQMNVLVSRKMKRKFLFCVLCLMAAYGEDYNITKLYITGRSMVLSNHIRRYWGPIPSIPLMKNTSYLLLTGTLQIGEMSPIFWDTGSGKILYDLDMSKLCYYMTNKGTVSKNPLDVPLTYSIAVLCEVSSLSLRISELIIYPTCSLDKSSVVKRSSCSEMTSVTASFVSIYPYRSISMNSIAPSFVKQYSSLSRYSTSHAVCTAQTFKNELSGATLYLFVRYYLELNWIVIVFDRFRDHYEHLFSLLENPKFFYFPFTVLPQIYSKIYDESYRANQIKSFAHFNGLRVYESASKAQLMQREEEGNQNSDKRKTYIFARQLFATIKAMLYVDRDELLFCPPAVQSSTVTNFHSALAAQQHYQELFLRELLTNKITRLSAPRVMYSSQMPSDKYDHLYHLSTVQCIESVYQPNQTLASSVKIIQDMLRCLGSNLVGEKKRYGRKSMDLSVGGICPFNGVHVLCQRCNCKESRPTNERCHLIHYGWISRPLLSQSSLSHPPDLDKIYPNKTYLDIFRTFLSLKD